METGERDHRTPRPGADDGHTVACARRQTAATERERFPRAVGHGSGYTGADGASVGGRRSVAAMTASG